MEIFRPDLGPSPDRFFLTIGIDEYRPGTCRLGNGAVTRFAHGGGDEPDNARFAPGAGDQNPQGNAPQPPFEQDSLHRKIDKECG